jgi:aspartate/tyrosine/aromatic aminotransferase
MNARQLLSGVKSNLRDEGRQLESRTWASHENIVKNKNVKEEDDQYSENQLHWEQFRGLCELI